MQLRNLAVLAVILGSYQIALATTCFVPPPCGRITSRSVVLIGTVLAVSVMPSPADKTLSEALIQVDELFEGLPVGTRELTVRNAEATRFERGNQYLLSVYRTDDGRFSPSICGDTAVISDPSIRPIVDYLRLRAGGKAKSVIKVHVTDQHRPVEGVDVQVTAQAMRLTGRTDTEGNVEFEVPQPGKYSINAAKQNYHYGNEGLSDREVEVVHGTCPTARIELEAEGIVSGLLRDTNGLPVPLVSLEMIPAPTEPAQGDDSDVSPNFSAKTDESGRFVFQSVSPGRYFLGANIMGLDSSIVPRTYYPGQRSVDGAIPIEIGPGETVENLLFTLPYFGSKRQIQICVVNKIGVSVQGAEINADYQQSDANTAGLGDGLVTDSKGCVLTTGYSRAIYNIRASSRPSGNDIMQSKFSETSRIMPGAEPVRIVLKLK